MSKKEKLDVVKAEAKAEKEKHKAAKAEAKKIKKTKTPLSKDKVRKMLMGGKEDMGLLKKIAVYAILIGVGFIFILPILSIISTSFMSLDDLLDPGITWFPSEFSFDNYKLAMDTLDYWVAFKDSIIVSTVPTLIQICSCSVIGYGLARYNFKGRKLIFGIIILSFIMPQQLTILETVRTYSDLKLMYSIKAFAVPAIFGQGLKAQLFILICWSFFKQIPKALSEAAQIDGAGHFKQFFKIAIPSAAGALVVVGLFSFVWYWNEEYLSNLYFYTASNDTPGLKPLITQLSKFDGEYAASLNVNSSTETRPSLNTSLSMCATVLTILPLLIVYFILQKQFVESVDRAGITGE